MKILVIHWMNLGYVFAAYDRGEIVIQKISFYNTRIRNKLYNQAANLLNQSIKIAEENPDWYTRLGISVSDNRWPLKLDGELPIFLRIFSIDHVDDLLWYHPQLTRVCQDDFKSFIELCKLLSLESV